MEETFDHLDASVDPRTFEKQFFQLDYIIADKNFKTETELNDFLEEVFAHQEHWDDFISNHKRTNRETAQEILYDAFGASEPKEKINLARKAISFYPNSPDAYVILAEEHATSLKDALKYYTKGVDAGRMDIPATAFKEFRGKFYYMTSYRPFLRALAGLAVANWEAGNAEKGNQLAAELLELDSEDFIGIRMEYLINLLGSSAIDDAVKLIKMFPDDENYLWRLCKTFIHFIKHGATPKGVNVLKGVIKTNPFVGIIIIASIADHSLQKYLEIDDELLEETMLDMEDFLSAIEDYNEVTTAFISEVLLLKDFTLKQLNKIHKD